MVPLLSGLVLVGALIGVSYIDVREKRIPDYLSLPLVALGLGYGAWLGTPAASAIGAAVAYASFVTIEQVYLRLRGRHGLGRGDAKLFAAGGAWCGWVALPSILLVASVSGVIFALLTQAKSADTKIPFGPFLSLGIVITFFVLHE